jgi:disulfide bond formation protein DsbB
MNENEINDQFSKQFGANMNPHPMQLPNAISSLVLGIISAFFGLVWCYSIGSLIGLVCGIIAIVHAKKAKVLYEANPQTFKPASVGNANAGRILGIIGICLSILGFVLMIIIVIAMMAFGSAAAWH